MARCSYVNPTNMKRCKRKAIIGNYCGIEKHYQSERKLADLVRRENRKIQPLRYKYGATVVPEHDIASNPTGGYTLELRRTAGNILACEEQIAKLRSEDIVWGLVKEEVSHGNSAVNTFVKQEHAARLNEWVQLALKEREHYTRLVEIGIKANLDARRIMLQEQLVHQLQAAITNILSRSGLDPEDPTLRATIREELIAVETLSADIPEGELQ